jgi:hypothetical protein
MILVASILALWPNYRLHVLLHFVGIRDSNGQGRSLTLCHSNKLYQPLYAIPESERRQNSR